MHKLLDKEERISLDILYFFSKNKQQKMILLKDIAHELSYDPRKLIRHIENLVEDIEVYLWQSEIKLTIVNDEIHYEMSESFAVDFFESEYLKNSILFKLCMDLYLDTFTNLTAFAKANFVSQSTIYRRVKKLKRLLADFDIELDLLAPHYFIGQEYQIRYFFYSLISTAYYYNSEQTSDYISMERTKVFDRFIQLIPHFPYASEVKLRIILDLTIDRISKGFIVEKNEAAFQLKSVQFDYETLYGFFRPFIQLNDQALEQEATFLHFILHVGNVYSIHEFTLEQLEDRVPPNEKTEKIEAVILLFQSFFNCTLTMREHHYIERNLYYIFKRAAIIHGSEHIESLQFNLKTIADAHPYIADLLLRFFDFLKKELQITLRDDLLLQLFLVFREVIWKVRMPIKVCLLSKISSSQQYYLREKLVTDLKLPIELFAVVDDDTEIIIADYSVKAFYDERVDFYFIPSFPDANEWLHLIQAIQAKYHEVIKAKIDER